MTEGGINKRALFSDGTDDYVIPSECDEGDIIRIRLRTLKDDAESVYFILVKDEEDEESEMTKADSDELFDYYEISITAGSSPIQYYFEIIKDGEKCLYTRLGADGALGRRFYFRIIPGFHVPLWMKGCVMYQIFVDRFYNGDKDNDVRTGEYGYLNGQSERVMDWDSPIESLDVGRFYGGDLKGVEEKLPYLKELGIEAIYFNPLFVSPSNHKYDCQDYEHIDPHYTVIKNDGDYKTRSADRENLEASDRYFSEFIKKCHRAGIRVIVDGVFNHCGSFNKMMDAESIYKDMPGYEPGAFHTRDSIYHDYFRFENDDPSAWPGNSSYEKWWKNETLPKLNYEGSEELIDYVMDIGRKWVSSPYGADGWRLDVAADLSHSEEFNHGFWKKFRQAVKGANPEAVIFAEHYGDPSSWLQGDEWDTVMNYDAFMEPVTWYLTGMEKHSDWKKPELCGDGKAFFDTMRYAWCNMQHSSILSSMNELSNHDHSRFLTRTNKTIGRLQTSGSDAASEGLNFGLFSAAVTIQMTWPGAPTVYYGDEAGVCGWTDPDSRRTYPWGHENHHVLDFHTYMISIHKHDVFRYGSMKELCIQGPLIAYGRMYGKNAALVVINAGECSMDVDIPVWEIGITDDMTLTRVLASNQDKYNVGYHHRGSKNGYLHCRMMPYSSKVYINWAADEHNVTWVDRY